MSVFDASTIANLDLDIDSTQATVYKDAGTTLCANGDTVQQWNFTSGLGGNASQGTSGNRPTYTTNAGSTGFNGVTFASNKFLTTSISAAQNPFTLAAVIYHTAITTGHAYPYVGAGASPAFGAEVGTDGAAGAVFVNKQNSVAMGASSGNLTVNTLSLVTVSYDGTTMTFRIGGAASGTATNTQTFGSSNVYIGVNGDDLTGETMVGHIFRIIRYQRSLAGSGDMTTLENGLISQYFTPPPTTNKHKRLCIMGVGH